MIDTEMELAKAIKEGTLDLICPEMELLVCPSYRDVALKGTGVIRADTLGRLYFRMVSTFDGPFHDVLQSSKQPGEIYDPQDHVMLRAVDEVGREWRSNWMIVDLSNHIPLLNCRLRKNLSNIMYSRARKKGDHSSIRVLVPASPSMPFDMVTHERKTIGEREIGWSSSVDHHVHSIGEAEVTFRRGEDGWLSVIAIQPDAFMPTWAGLLCHALGFVTAQTITPAVITRRFNESEDLALFSGPFWRFASAMPGPVHFDGPESAGDFWRLVELFFNHVEQKQFENNPLLEELVGIRRGAQGSFQTACLTLGVGIESIAKLLLKDETPPKVCSKVMGALMDHLDAWPGDVAVKRRAKGALGRLAEISAADLLYAWATRTGASRELVDRWKKLRHPKAHGKALDDKQVGYDLYYSSVELMYRVVASGIGYDGRIVPTSRRGWTESDSTDDGELREQAG